MPGAQYATLMLLARTLPPWANQTQLWSWECNIWRALPFNEQSPFVRLAPG